MLRTEYLISETTVFGNIWVKWTKRNKCNHSSAIPKALYIITFPILWFCYWLG